MAFSRKRPQLNPAEFKEDLLAELQQQTASEIRKIRKHDRLEVKLEITLQHANLSEGQDALTQGYTKDVSRSGCGAVFEDAPRVGDVYRVSITSSGPLADAGFGDLPKVYGRCLRCVFVREGAFDAGFEFLRELDLPERVGGADEKDEGLLG